jgi:nicotinamide-nucleotide amidase
MPGVPAEMKTMLSESVLPYLKERFNIQQVILHRTLLVRTLGESRVDALITDLFENSENPTIGLLATPGCVQIRMTACAHDRNAALDLIAPLEQKIRERIAPYENGLEIK